jgi:DNA-binding NarL/FixJ family response regulator
LVSVGREGGEVDERVAAAIAGLREVIDADDSATAHAELGGFLYFLDDFQGARRHWERAFRRFREGGELRPAVRVAADLAEVHMSALGNPSAANGWLGRARRLVDIAGRCPEEGYLELAVVACDRPDVDAVERSAGIALGLAIEFGDHDLEVRALADSGLAMVTQGRITEGFARLDEAMSALSAGEVSNPTVTGRSFCAMVSACDRAGDFRRAEEWIRLIDEVMREQFWGTPPILATHCGVAYGSVLCTAGRWSDAEATLLDAVGPSASASFSHHVDAVVRLADLRLLQGRVEEAAALVGPYADQLAACPTLARIHLLQGDCDLAAAVIRRTVKALVGDRLRAGVLEGLLVEVELSRGDLAAAHAAATRLTALAASGDAEALVAEAAVAEARVAMARGEPDAAVVALDAAEPIGRDEERPVLAATVRTERAIALAATGATAEATDEARAALATFERLGADRHADRVAALLRRLGGGSRTRTRSAAKAVDTLSQREREVLQLLQAGCTNAEIGERLYISPKTAEHHVGRILTKLGVRSRAEAAAMGVANGVANRGAE